VCAHLCILNDTDSGIIRWFPKTESALKVAYPVVARTYSSPIYDASFGFLNESTSKAETQMSF